LILKLDQRHKFWFDEGWVTSVAQNWIHLSHYGQLLNGTPISDGMLKIGFPAIGPISLSFAISRVGVWQGRLPGVLFAAGSFLLLYQLSENYMGR
jgi:hypothetical protein